jgi:hypothetical protein
VGLLYAHYIKYIPFYLKHFIFFGNPSLPGTFYEYKPTYLGGNDSLKIVRVPFENRDGVRASRSEPGRYINFYGLNTDFTVLSDRAGTVPARSPASRFSPNTGVLREKPRNY